MAPSDQSPSTIVVAFSGTLTRAAIPGLCERVRVLLDDSGANVLVCDVSAIDDPDAVAVDALARMQLTARRMGRSIRLSRACDRLRGLLTLAGLTDVLPPYYSR